MGVNRENFHVPVLKKVFNFVENAVNWSDGVIMNLCHFFIKIVHMTW